MKAILLLMLSIAAPLRCLHENGIKELEDEIEDLQKKLDGDKRQCDQTYWTADKLRVLGCQLDCHGNYGHLLRKPGVSYVYECDIGDCGYIPRDYECCEHHYTLLGCEICYQSYIDNLCKDKKTKEKIFQLQQKLDMEKRLAWMQKPLWQRWSVLVLIFPLIWLYLKYRLAFQQDI